MSMFCIKATQIYGWPFRATEEPVQHLAAQKFCFTLWQNDLQSSWHLIHAAEYRESSTNTLDFLCTILNSRYQNICRYPGNRYLDTPILTADTLQNFLGSDSEYQIPKTADKSAQIHRSGNIGTPLIMTYTRRIGTFHIFDKI